MEANAIMAQDARSYVHFVHACLGYPAPSTFLNAVTNGFITGPEQFPRLTTKMVRKHLPNTLPTAKGHLDRTPAALPHALSARWPDTTLGPLVPKCFNWLGRLSLQNHSP